MVNKFNNLMDNYFLTNSLALVANGALEKIIYPTNDTQWRYG